MQRYNCAADVLEDAGTIRVQQRRRNRDQNGGLVLELLADSISWKKRLHYFATDAIWQERFHLHFTFIWRGFCLKWWGTFMALELKWNQSPSLVRGQTAQTCCGDKNTTYIETNVENKPVPEQASQLWHCGGCAFTSQWPSPSANTSASMLISALVYNTKED